MARSKQSERDAGFAGFMERITAPVKEEDQLTRIKSAMDINDLSDADLLFVLVHELDKIGQLGKTAGNLVEHLRYRNRQRTVRMQEAR